MGGGGGGGRVHGNNRQCGVFEILFKGISHDHDLIVGEI